MSVIVQKFGGTSLGDVESIHRVATLIAEEVRKKHRVVVVVSAMAGETNRLVELAAQVSVVPDSQEYDVVVSTGEQVSCGLVAMALQGQGIQACSLMAWQLPIKTDAAHTQARIEDVDVLGLQEALQEGSVVVVPGFQGISSKQRITTLGRGGSDITAVCLAAALKADQCDIYTDVEGVYTSDPRVVTNANKLDKISYEGMLEFSTHGAKVIHPRAVELAFNHSVRLRVLSSFTPSTGTIIVDEEEIVEKGNIQGIILNREQSLVILKNLAVKASLQPKILKVLSENKIPFDMLSQTLLEGEEKQLDLSFVISQKDADRARLALEKIEGGASLKTIVIRPDVALVTLIGCGLSTNPELLSRLYAVLGHKSVELLGLLTSNTKIGILIPDEYAELLVRSLHTEYDLDIVRAA